jgi:hypothetical protein
VPYEVSDPGDFVSSFSTFRRRFLDSTLPGVSRHALSTLIALSKDELASLNRPLSGCAEWVPPTRTEPSFNRYVPANIYQTKIIESFKLNGVFISNYDTPLNECRLPLTSPVKLTRALVSPFVPLFVPSFTPALPPSYHLLDCAVSTPVVERELNQPLVPFNNHFNTFEGGKNLTCCTVV